MIERPDDPPCEVFESDPSPETVTFKINFSLTSVIALAGGEKYLDAEGQPTPIACLTGSGPDDWVECDYVGRLGTSLAGQVNVVALLSGVTISPFIDMATWPVNGDFPEHCFPSSAPYYGCGGSEDRSLGYKWKITVVGEEELLNVTVDRSASIPFRGVYGNVELLGSFNDSLTITGSVEVECIESTVYRYDGFVRPLSSNDCAIVPPSSRPFICQFPDQSAAWKPGVVAKRSLMRTGAIKLYLHIPGLGDYNFTMYEAPAEPEPFTVPDTIGHIHARSAVNPDGSGCTAPDYMQAGGFALSGSVPTLGGERSGKFGYIKDLEKWPSVPASWYTEINGGSVTFTVKSEGYSCACNLTCKELPSKIDFGGPVRDIAGNAVEGMQVVAIQAPHEWIPPEGETPGYWTCDNWNSNLFYWGSDSENMIAEFNGWWILQYGGGGDYDTYGWDGQWAHEWKDIPCVREAYNPSTGEWGIQLADEGPVVAQAFLWPGGLPDVGQPAFNLEDPDYAFGDYRLPLRIAEADRAPIAIQHSGDKTIVTFGDYTWTPTNCDVDIDGDDIVVSNVEPGASITKTFTDRYLSHFRWARVNASGGTCRFAIGEKKWDLKLGSTPADAWIDLFQPAGASGTSTDDSYIEQDSEIGSWARGVQKIVSITIDELQEGKTYRFKTLGGYVRHHARVVMFPQPSWANFQDQDDYSKYRDEIHEEPDNFYFRAGVIIVDGVIVTEIPAGQHATTGSYRSALPALWAEESFTIFPGDPHGVYTIEASENGPYEVPTLLQTCWDSGLLWLCGCLQDEQSLPAVLTVDQVVADEGIQLIDAQIYKRFGGRAFVTVWDQGGEPKVGTRVRIEGWGSQDDIVYTDAMGAAYFPPSMQGESHRVTITLLDASPQEQFYLQVRNRAIMWAGIPATFPGEPQPGEDLDTLIDVLTGAAIMAVVSGEELLARRSDNYGRVWEAGVAVSDNQPSRPCVLQDVTGDKRLFGLAWNEGATAKIAWSADGFATKEVSTLMSGVTNVRVRVHPLTGIMLVAAWDSTAESIIVQRSFDKGATLVPEPPVVVAEVPEQAFGLDLAPTDMDTWVLTCRDGNGTIITYWSSDNGLSWQAAA